MLIPSRFPAVENWASQVFWDPRNPGLLVVEYPHGTIVVCMVQSTNDSVQSCTPATTSKSDGSNVFDLTDFLVQHDQQHHPRNRLCTCINFISLLWLISFGGEPTSRRWKGPDYCRSPTKGRDGNKSGGERGSCEPPMALRVLSTSHRRPAKGHAPTIHRTGRR